MQRNGDALESVVSAVRAKVLLVAITAAAIRPSEPSEPVARTTKAPLTERPAARPRTEDGWVTAANPGINTAADAISNRRLRESVLRGEK